MHRIKNSNKSKIYIKCIIYNKHIQHPKKLKIKNLQIGIIGRGHRMVKGLNKSEK